MKRIAKKELIEILCNKSNCSYKELSVLTGYHPKSLVRINSMIKKEKYKILEEERNEMHRSIITNFLQSNYKTYKEFYNSINFKYKISYSTLCNILKSTKTTTEIVFIRKIKNKNNSYFEVADAIKKTTLFTYDSNKNDIKSIKNIIYMLLKNYGSPKNISFVNFNIPISIHDLLNKYDINIINFKSSYRNCFNNSSNIKDIKYRHKKIIKEDFYNSITRKTIANNIIQFNNTRYKIKTKNIIKLHTKLILYYDNTQKDLFIKHNNQIYNLTVLKNVSSKKGASKYL